MRRTNRPPAKPSIRRAVAALALVALGFGLGRAVPSRPATLPHPNDRQPHPVPLAASPGDSPAVPAPPGPWRDDILCASHCDVSRAAEEAFAVRDPLADPLRFRVQVLRVVDGDTIRVRWHGRDTAVRLLRIDTPESGQPAGITH